MSVSLDLAHARFEVDPVSTAENKAHIQITDSSQVISISLHKGEKFQGELQRDLCLQTSASIIIELQTCLAAITPAEQQIVIPLESRSRLKAIAGFDDWHKVNERIRDLTVETRPLPTNGFPEQLIDTVYPQIRESSQQWPAASLKLVGDSLVDPFFKIFKPIPQGIRIAVSDQRSGSHWEHCEVEPRTATAVQQSYRGYEDRLDAQFFEINRKACRLHLTVPAPSQGRMLVLNEVEVFSANQVNPAIRFLTCAIPC